MLGKQQEISKLALIRARRTAFVSKFIILRENKISRSHAILERLHWDDTTTYYDLYRAFYKILRAFDKPLCFKKDLDKAKEHAKTLSPTFVREYANRSGQSFLEALIDYEKSVYILFGADHLRTLLGWAPASIIARNCSPVHINSVKDILRSIDPTRKSRKKPLTHQKPKQSVVKKVKGTKKIIDVRDRVLEKVIKVKSPPKRAAR